jgi:hypothetical protein
MKAKLILKHRGDYDYFLVSRTDNSEALYASLNPDGEFENKLSKQNCDEIFGIIDVEKLAEEEYKSHASNEDLYGNSEDLQLAYKAGVVEGFNKAMELNKDKVFTLSDISYAISFSGKMKPSEIVRNLLQQPTEIEVEIEMELEIDTSKLIGAIYGHKPKLDSEGCLILKRIV